METSMLSIKKNGAIQGGEYDWSYNEDDKSIHFSGYVKIKFGPIKKSTSFNDNFAVEKEKLLSANVKQGDVIEIDGGTIQVLSFAADRAITQVNAKDYSGVIEFDTSKEMIDPVSVNLKANYSGIKVTIHAERI